MFEGALVESRGQLQSPMVRWTAAGSIVVQSGLAALLVALPILRPDTLHKLAKAPELIAPAVPKPAPIARVRIAQTSTMANALSVSCTRIESDRTLIRNLLPRLFGQDEPAPLGPAVALTMGGADTLRLGTAGVGSGVAPNVTRATPPGPVRVSSGVSTGLLLSTIQPIYPAIAKAARIEGTVVVEAVISKTGRIESARAVSGPEMLRRAAVDAVAAARYRPFELNSQPVEVQTTVTVNFKLGG